MLRGSTKLQGLCNKSRKDVPLFEAGPALLVTQVLLEGGALYDWLGEILCAVIRWLASLWIC